MKKFLFIFISTLLIISCNRNEAPDILSEKILDDTLSTTITSIFYDVDLDDNGSIDAQFHFYHGMSPGGYNVSFTKVEIKNDDFRIHTTTSIDTICLDTILYADTIETYLYSNCTEDNFHNLDTFIYADLIIEETLYSISFTDNFTDTVNIQYQDHSNSAGNWPGEIDFDIIQGVPFSSAEKFFVFRNMENERYAVGVKAITYHVIFTRIKYPD